MNNTRFYSTFLIGKFSFSFRSFWNSNRIDLDRQWNAPISSPFRFRWVTLWCISLWLLFFVLVLISLVSNKLHSKIFFCKIQTFVLSKSRNAFVFFSQRLQLYHFWCSKCWSNGVVVSRIDQCLSSNENQSNYFQSAGLRESRCRCWKYFDTFGTKTSDWQWIGRWRRNCSLKNRIWSMMDWHFFFLLAEFSRQIRFWRHSFHLSESTWVAHFEKFQINGRTR